jgi:hypothetical protein
MTTAAAMSGTGVVAALSRTTTKPPTTKKTWARARRNAGGASPTRAWQSQLALDQVVDAAQKERRCDEYRGLPLAVAVR